MQPCGLKKIVTLSESGHHIRGVPWTSMHWDMPAHSVTSAGSYLYNTSMGGEGMEMLCKGTSASTDNTCAGKITMIEFP